MDIGLAVGGAFLSSALQVLFDRLAPRGELLKLFRRDKRDVRLLKKLRMTLLGLQAVLSDAEKKQASNPYMSQWLNELQDAADTAENLMEEINYEVLRVTIEGNHQNLAETSKQHVNNLNLCLSDEFFQSIKERLEDSVETLEDLQNQIGHLDLKAFLDSSKQEPRNPRSPSTSVVDESDVFGRHDQIEELVDRLLSIDDNGKNLTIIAIVGMGGIGKTTLAQVAYNDEKVQKYFDLKAWICVSQPFDVLAITKGLLQELGSFDLKDDNNLNQLQIRLKESLKGKRFLVVLDDVWNEEYNEWNDLRNLLVRGDVGSKIIVTTRKENVALMMGSGAMKVGILSSEVSWALFKRHSLEYRDLEEQPELEVVGKQIADKCKGLPLALKTLAGMLRSKSEVEEWRNVLRNEKWELPNQSSGILPALMLSYDELPVHLKRCFAYCAIFPKDYPFCKELVVHLWIANGLVKWFHLGKQYFLELRSRSLFERVPRSSQRNTEKFLMHDLVNDLAKTASSNLCIRLEENEGSHVLERSRHLSYSMGFGDFDKLKSLDKLEQLRTLLPITFEVLGSFSLSKRVLHNILPTLTSLRALSLSRYGIKELPDVLFIQLKLLRFLDLSLNMIKRLPDSVCALYNLDTFLLSSCFVLVELPPKMENLTNLCHLDISGCSSLKMPLNLMKLKSLHVISGVRFVLGGCTSGSRIGDLGKLHNLCGSLSIVELQKVVDRWEALKANMSGKVQVEKLSLEWSGGTAKSSQNERDILGELQPSRNIKELEIKGYRGTKFPDWLADQLFLKLVKLSLRNCNDCDSLPALGQLPSLKFLAIQQMHRITELTEEFYGDSSSRKPFNSLEKLEFAMMPEWKKWHVLGIGEFPALEYLSIVDCPKLIGMFPENLCSLTRLKILKCPEINLETPIQLSSLKTFEVIGSPKVGVLFDDAELFASQLEGMNQLVELKISGCDSVTSLPISRLSNTLKDIYISGCAKLKLEPSDGEMISSGYSDMFVGSLTLDACDSCEELVPRARELRVDRCISLRKLIILTGTQVLEISDCENLEILSVAYGKTTSLYRLLICNCKKLKSLPERMLELLPSLNELRMCNCPEIESFPKGRLPFNLEVLEIRYCKKLVNGRKKWCLQTLPCLRELIIYHDGSDEEIHWEFPCSIRKLWIVNLKTISSQVLESLTSLEYLYASNLPQVWSLLEEGLPSSLCELHLYVHNELHSIPIEGLRSLTSLRSLKIFSCNQLQSIPESALPSSLSMLTIRVCPNLQSLPVKGMPSFMSQLFIYNCPKLKPFLEFEKGDYWPQIAHIPTIAIDCEHQ